MAQLFFFFDHAQSDVPKVGVALCYNVDIHRFALKLNVELTYELFGFKKFIAFSQKPNVCNDQSSYLIS